MAERLKLKNVRISYPSLFKAKAVKGADEATAKFSAVFLIPKDDAQAKTLIATVFKVAQEEAKFKTLFKDPKKWPVKLNNPIKDGDELVDNNPEYAGCYVINASCKNRPVVLDRKCNPLTEEDGVIYAGCYVNASIAVGAYDVASKGVACYLNGVQFVKDGERLAGYDAMADFDDLDGEEVDGADYDL